MVFDLQNSFLLSSQKAEDSLLTLASSNTSATPPSDGSLQQGENLQRRFARNGHKPRSPRSPRSGLRMHSNSYDPDAAGSTSDLDEEYASFDSLGLTSLRILGFEVRVLSSLFTL